MGENRRRRSDELVLGRRLVRVDLGIDGLVLVVLMVGLDLLDLSVETVHVVGRVLDHAGRAVGFHEAVRSLHVAVPVADLVLAVHVVRVGVLDAVREVVRSGRRVLVMVVVVDLNVVVVLRRETGYQTRERGDGGRDQKQNLWRETDRKNTCTHRLFRIRSLILTLITDRSHRQGWNSARS